MDSITDLTGSLPYHVVVQTASIRGQHGREITIVHLFVARGQKLVAEAHVVIRSGINPTQVVQGVRAVVAGGDEIPLLEGGPVFQGVVVSPESPPGQSQTHPPAVGLIGSGRLVAVGIPGVDPSGFRRQGNDLVIRVNGITHERAQMGVTN